MELLRLPESLQNQSGFVISRQVLGNKLTQYGPYSGFQVPIMRKAIGYIYFSIGSP